MQFRNFMTRSGRIFEHVSWKGRSGWRVPYSRSISSTHQTGTRNASSVTETAATGMISGSGLGTCSLFTAVMAFRLVAPYSLFPSEPNGAFGVASGVRAREQ